MAEEQGVQSLTGRAAVLRMLAEPSLKGMAETAYFPIALTIVSNIGLLAYYKYSNFLVDALNSPSAAAVTR